MVARKQLEDLAESGGGFRETARVVGLHRLVVKVPGGLLGRQELLLRGVDPDALRLALDRDGVEEAAGRASPILSRRNSEIRSGW